MTERIGITWTDNSDDNAVEAINKAIDDNYRELIAPGWYLPEIAKNSNGVIKTNTMGEAETAVVKRVSDNAPLRIWLSTDYAPQDFCEGLERFRKVRPTFISSTILGQELLREGTTARSKNPRWQLQDEVNKIWDPSENQLRLSPQRWGLDRKELQKVDRIEYDKNKAYLSAFTQARLAPAMEDGWTHYDSNNISSLPKLDSKVSGMVKIILPEWKSPLPNPAGKSGNVGDEIWTTIELMKLYHERGITPRIIEAYLSPASSITAVNNMTKSYKSLLETFKGDEICEYFIKKSYASFAGIIGSRNFSMKRPDFCYRPDWAMAIKDNSWANCCRMAYKIYDADNRYIPYALNIDALFYDKALPTPPLLPIGDSISNFKIKEHKKIENIKGDEK